MSSLRVRLDGYEHPVRLLIESKEIPHEIIWEGSTHRLFSQDGETFVYQRISKFIATGANSRRLEEEA